MLHTALLTIAVSVAQVPDSAVRVQALDEASVTAHRNTTTRSSAPLRRVTAADIERRGAVGIEEMLRTMAGVGVKDYGGIGGLKTVSIRSFGAQHTGVLYDGIAVTDVMNGQVDIGRFNLSEVAEVRVDVAGSDNIFRPAKLAGYVGTVEITSSATASAPVEADRSVGGSVSMRSSSFATYNPTASLRCSLGSAWQISAWGDYLNSRGDYPFRLHNGKLTTDEVRLNSQVSRFNGEVAASAFYDRFGTLRLKASAYDSSRGLPGSVILYTQHPTEHLWDRHLSASAQHLLQRSRWQMKTSLSYTNAYNRYLDSAPQRPEPEDDRYTQQQVALSAVGLFRATESLSFSLAEDVDVTHLTSNLPAAAQPTRVSSYSALSAKFSVDRFTAVGTLLGFVCGERANVVEGGADNDRARQERHRFSPTLSCSYRLLRNEDLRLRASYKESYRQPTFNDLYYLRVGNRNLRPERAEQFNVGATWQHDFGRASTARRRFHQALPQTGGDGGGHLLALTADAYYNHVRDKIVAIPTMFIWHMRNVGRVRMYGFDLTANYRAPLAPWLSLHADANYSLQYALDVTNAAAKNYRHQIAYTPRHSGSTTVSAVFPWFTASYTLVAVGERYSLAQNTPAYRIEPYCDHSVSLNHTFDYHRFRLHASAEALNLSGHNYEVVKYYPMPGRQWRVTLRFSY